MPTPDQPAARYPQDYADLFAQLEKTQEREASVDEWMRTRGPSNTLGYDLRPGTGRFRTGLSSIISLGQRGLETVGLLDEGTADETNRWADALRARLNESIADRVPEGFGRKVATGLGDAADVATQAAILTAASRVMPGALGRFAAGRYGLAAGFGMTSANQAYTRAIDRDLDTGDAAAYALTAGTLEGLITATGARFGLGGFERNPALQKGVQRAAQTIASRLGAKGAEALKQYVAENVEEASILVAQNIADVGFGVNEKAWETFGDNLATTLLNTSLLTGIGEGVRGAADAGSALTANDPKRIEKAARQVQEIAQGAAKQADLAPPGTKVQTAELPPPRMVDKTTREPEPSLEDRIQATGIEPPSRMSDPVYQESLDAAAETLISMPELQGSTIERHNNSLRVRFGPEGGSTEVVIAHPTEMAQYILDNNPDNAWASIAEHAGQQGVTRAQWDSMSRPKKLALLQDAGQGSILFNPKGDAVPLGTDSLVYLTDGRATPDVVQEEFAHRAFVSKTTDAELGILRDFMDELGAGGAWRRNLRNDAAFQEAIVNRLYRPYVAGELQLPEAKKTSAVRRIFDRMQNFFRRLLGVAQVAQRLPQPSRTRVQAEAVLGQVQSGELQQRQGLPTDQTTPETLLQNRLQGIRKDAQAEARDIKKTKAALAAPVEGETRQRRAELGKRAVTERERQAPVKERQAQDREALADIAADRRLQQEADMERRGFTKQRQAQDREALTDIAADRRLQREAEAERQGQDRGALADLAADRRLQREAEAERQGQDRGALADLAADRRLQREAEVERQGQDRGALTDLAADRRLQREAEVERQGQDRGALTDLAADRRLQREAEAERQGQDREALADLTTDQRLQREADAEKRGAAKQRQAEDAEAVRDLQTENRAESAALTERANEIRGRRLDQRAEAALKEARQEIARTRNKRITAEEAADLARIERDLQTAEDILLSLQGESPLLIDSTRKRIFELKREARLLRLESRAGRAENTAISAEGGQGPLMSLTPSAPQPETRAAEARLADAREEDTGRRDRMLRMGQFLLETNGWRALIEEAERQTAELGPGRLSDPVRAGLIAARQHIRTKYPQFLRRGTANRYNRALERVELLMQQNYGEAGARLGELKHFNEATDPLQRADKVYAEVTKPPAKVAREIAKLRRRGQDAEADALLAEAEQKQWDAYEARLAEVGLKPEDIMRDDLTEGQATLFNIAITEGRYTTFDKAMAVLGAAQRLALFGFSSGARVGGLIAPAVFLLDVSTKTAQGVGNDTVRMLSAGTVDPGPGAKDTTKSIALGLAHMRLAPKLMWENLVEGRESLINRAREGRPFGLDVDPTDPGATQSYAEIFLPGSSTRRRVARALIESTPRIIGASDVWLKAYASGSGTYLGAREYLRETRPDLKEGTAAFDNEMVRQMGTDTRSDGVQEHVEQGILEASAALPFNRKRGIGRVLSEAERTISQGAVPKRVALQAVFPVFRTAVQGGVQLARHAPGSSAAMLAFDYYNARKTDASFAERMRAQAQLYRTLTAHMTPFLLALLLDGESAEELSKGNIAGVNASYIPLLGSLLEAYGDYTKAVQEGSIEQAWEASNLLAWKLLGESVPGARFLGIGMRKDSEILEQMLTNSPAGRIAKVAVEIDEDTEPKEALYNFLNATAPPRDVLRLLSDDFVQHMDEQTRLDMGKAGVAAALGLKEER